MNKWQMSGRTMPNRWSKSDFDVPPAGQKAHLQRSIHPNGRQRKASFIARSQQPAANHG